MILLEKIMTFQTFRYYDTVFLKQLSWLAQLMFLDFRVEVDLKTSESPTVAVDSCCQDVSSTVASLRVKVDGVLSRVRGLSWLVLPRGPRPKK